MNDETEIVKNSQWQNYAKRIEKKNLREKGTSLTFTGIMRRANPFIVLIEGDKDQIIFRKGWREAMKKER